MNWESSLLNKIYKTIEFKVKNPNILALQQQKKEKINLINKEQDGNIPKDDSNKNLQNKNPFPKLISSLIEKYELNLSNLKSNKKGAIYRVKENGNTEYFDYFTDYMFYQYCHFFSFDEKYIPKQKIEFLNKEILILLNKYNIQYNGKQENAFYYFAFLMLFNRNNSNSTNIYFSVINDLLSDRIFLYDTQPTSHDIVLLSIFYYSTMQQDKDKYFSTFKNLDKWFHYLENKLEINFEKIHTSYQFYFDDLSGDSYKYTSCEELVQAVQRLNMSKTRSLLEQEENVESRQTKDYKSLAHIACRNGNIEMLKLLLEFGCDLESNDIENMTPLFDAIYSGNIELCEFLIEEKKVNINHIECQDRNIFYWACCAGDLKIVDYLQSKKSLNFNLASKMGRTPLSKACWNGQIDVVQRLLKIPGLNLNSIDSNERTPLHNAVWGENGGRLGKKGISSKDSPECTQALIEAGANLECLDKEKYTPLMLAASTKGIESLKLLICYDANINHTNVYNATPLIEAARYGNTESVLTLIEYGKNIDFLHRDINNMNVYDYCAVENVDDCLEILLKTNMLGVEDVFISLDFTIYSKNINTFKLLLKIMKQNFNIKDEIVRKKVTIALEKIVNIFRYSHLIHVINDEDLNNAFEDLIYSESMMIRFILSVEIALTQSEEKTKNSKNIQPSSCYNIDFEELLNLNKIIEKRDKIINSYLEYLKDKNKAVPISFMKSLIFADLLDSFFKCYYYNLNLEYSNEETIVVFDKNNYIIRLPKNKRIEEYSVHHYWADSINNFNNYNILFHALLNDNQEYSFVLLKNELFDKFFFEKSKESHNILHILFSNDNISKFKLLINKFEYLCEKHQINRYLKINELLNENDDHLLLPIDTALKKRNYNVLTEYSDYMTSTLKLNIENCPEKLIDLNSTYKLLDIQIIESIEIYPSQEILEMNEKSLSDLFKIMSKTVLTKDEMFYSLNFLDFNYCFSLINKIIDKIEDSTIEKDFQIKNINYEYDMVNTEEKLILCRDHLLKHNFIGVDLEHYGENDKNGIACTLQLSSIDKSFVIDCLILRNHIHKFLKEIFENRNILKIFHGCDNDIKWLFSNFNLIPINIFDTARAYIYFQKFILNKEFNANYPSLFFLVKHFLEFKIDKSYQKADWRLRPLTSNMLQYALNDSKLIIYIFLLMIGLFFYMRNWNEYFNEKMLEPGKFYFERLKVKFIENKENVEKLKEKRTNENDIQFIFLRTLEDCLKTVNLKLVDHNYFNLLNIKNN